MAELPIGSEFAGHRVEALAGRGGMGVVYLATDLALERRVALKVISGQLAGDLGFHARFQRESRLAAQISHPHAITVYRAGEEDGIPYITMDYIEGEDLGALLKREGRLAPARAAEIVAQVAGALDAAHQLGLVHRDVKPANILIATRNGAPHAFLTDFGLTRRIESDSALTSTGLFVGTLSYAAPEQIRGESIDARTDVYSLGCVLYHLLVGAVPYPRDTPESAMAAHLFNPPPSPREQMPELAPALDEVVLKATAKDPDERYASAGDLGRAAVAAAAGAPAPAPAATTVMAKPAAVTTPAPPAPPVPGPTEPALRPAPPAPTAARPKRGWLIAAGIAAVVAVAAVVAIVAGGGGGGSGPGGLEGTVRAWLAAYNRNDNEAAATFWSLPAKGDRQPLTTVGQVVNFHKYYGCAIRPIAFNTNTNVVTIHGRLSRTPGRPCIKQGRGTIVDVALTLRNGKIVDFEFV